jgi:4-alpha-glucanotransferase
VGQWFLPAKQGDPTGASPPGSVASLNTHDTPTFAGWWQGTDITDQMDLKLIDARAEDKLLAERTLSKAAVLETAFDLPLLSDVERAMVGATAELSVGPAEVVLIALDDLALDPQPHNVPGTTSERPNWQRRVAKWETSLAETGAEPAAHAAMAAVTAARPR